MAPVDLRISTNVMGQLCFFGDCCSAAGELTPPFGQKFLFLTGLRILWVHELSLLCSTWMVSRQVVSIIPQVISSLLNLALKPASHSQAAFGLCDKTNLVTKLVTTVTTVTGQQTSSTMSPQSPVSTSRYSVITSSSTTISTTPSTTVASSSSVLSSLGSVCIRGTVVGKLLGLFDYCCHLGYCPPGYCSCLEYGAHVPPPAAT